MEFKGVKRIRRITTEPDIKRIKIKFRFGIMNLRP